MYDEEKRQYLKKSETAKPMTNVVFSPDGRYIVATLRAPEEEVKSFVRGSVSFIQRKQGELCFKNIRRRQI